MLVHLVVVGSLLTVGALLIGGTFWLPRLLRTNAATAAHLADRRTAAERRLQEWGAVLDRSRHVLPPDWPGEHLSRGRSALEQARRAVATLRELDALTENAGLALPPNPPLFADLRRLWCAPGARRHLRRLEHTAAVLQQALGDADRAFGYLLGERFALARRAALELQPVLERLQNVGRSRVPIAPGWSGRLEALEREFAHFRADLYGTADRPARTITALQQVWRHLHATAAALEDEHRRAQAEARRLAEEHAAIARRLEAAAAEVTGSDHTAKAVHYLLNFAQAALRVAAAHCSTADWSQGSLWHAHAERYETAAVLLKELASSADALEQALPLALRPVADEGGEVLAELRQTLDRLYRAEQLPSTAADSPQSVDERAVRIVEQATAELTAHPQRLEALLARHRADCERLNRLATAEEQAVRRARGALKALAPLPDDLLSHRFDDLMRQIGALHDRPQRLERWLADAADLRKKLDHARTVLAERRQTTAQALERLDDRIKALVVHAGGWHALRTPAAELQAGHKQLVGLQDKALLEPTARQCEASLEALRKPLATLKKVCERLERDGERLGDLFGEMTVLREALQQAGKPADAGRDHMVSHYYRRACKAEQTAEALTELQKAIDLLKTAL